MDRFFSFYTLICISAIFISDVSVSYSQENRTYDGTRNNLQNIDLGSVGQVYTRFAETNYTDGMGDIFNENLPNPRLVSNNLFAQESQIADSNNLSDFIWAFGQFICHDIEHVRYDENQKVGIEIPEGDDFFFGVSELEFSRKHNAINTGVNGVSREYLNEVSTYIDGSHIYGSDQVRANWLRTFNGGKLKTSSGGYMPWNTISGEYNSLVDDTAPVMKVKPGLYNQKLFVAGDLRANKNPSLIALHTIFLREHNRLCDQLAIENPNWDDERLYQRARKMIGAYLQKITYYDWLPSMGVHVESYTGYNANVDPSISNEFSAAGIVFEITLIGDEMLRLNNSGNTIDKGNLPIGSDYYYSPSTVLLDGVEPYLKGMSTQIQQEFDTKASDNIRNFDFNNDLSSAKDLVAERIFEGRDRGIAGYNEIRRSLGLPGFSSFANLTNDNSDVTQALESLYSSIDDVDLWVGLLAEGKKNNAVMGEVVTNIIKDQFRNLRDGDRLYYETETGVFTAYDFQTIESTALRDIIMRNSDITIMQENVFSAQEHGTIANGPELTSIHLETAVYPNPSTSTWVTLKMHADFDAVADMVIVDIHGRPLFTSQIKLRSGDNFEKINLDALSLERGYYIIMLSSENRVNNVGFLIE